MDRNTHARDAQLRAISVFEKRPESAQVINKGAAEVGDGLSCTYHQDGHDVIIDMPHAVGGSDQGPTPGFFARAAICGCLAIGIKMTAAREGLHLDKVRVAIEQDFDNRGVLGMADAHVAPKATRIVIDLASPENRETLQAMVDRALVHDPWFVAFRDAQPIETSITLAAEVD